MTTSTCLRAFMITSALALVLLFGLTGCTVAPENQWMVQYLQPDRPYRLSDYTPRYYQRPICDKRGCWVP